MNFTKTTDGRPCWNIQTGPGYTRTHGQVTFWVASDADGIVWHIARWAGQKWCNTSMPSESSSMFAIFRGGVQIDRTPRNFAAAKRIIQSIRDTED